MRELTIRVTLWVVVLALAGGCRREACKASAAARAACEAAMADSPVETPPLTASPAPPSAAMKPGMDKARQYQFEVLERQARSRQDQVTQSALAMAAAEAAARSTDSELGRMYSELVDSQIAYRKALEENPQYAEAKASNAVVLAEYSRLIDRRDSLKEEINHEQD